VAGGEYSVEVDPRTVDEARLALLFELGFNRLSFGVQDFDPEVQKAVHRIQPAQQVFDLVASARKIGFESINVDLIYYIINYPHYSSATIRVHRTLEVIDKILCILDTDAHAYQVLGKRPLTTHFLRDGSMRHLTRHRDERRHSSEADCDLEQLCCRHDVLRKLEVASLEANHRSSTRVKYE
jgi:hypothetical protein